MSNTVMFTSPPPTYDTLSSTRLASSTTLTPYLQLPHLLSLTWLAYPILSLVFVVFRLQLSLASSQDAIASAKDNLLASCKAAERAATAAASMPRYMAIATNEQFADAVNGSMNAARATLVLALTVMEAIINFIIDIYRSTFLCFLELVVRGGLSILISAVQELNKVVQSAASGIRTAIQNDIQAINSVIKSAIDAVNNVNPFNDISVPQLNVPDLSSLENVALPPSFQDALTKLNSSIPSVAELKDKVEAIIDTPFELLKKDINETFSGLSFNSSTLPVPQQNLVSFCSDLDLTVVDDLGHDLVRVAKIGTIILILLTFILIGLNCLLEWYKWRCMNQHLEYTRQAWVTDPTLYHSSPPLSSAPTVSLTNHNLLVLYANSAHPLLTRIANQLSSRLRLSPAQHTHLQWFFSYVFHPPALACFLIGFFGLLSVQIQLLALGPIEAKFNGAATSTASDFSNTIATSMNQSMYAQSSAYASDVNLRVDTTQNQINNGLFGWVNGTTTELNNTINNFYSEIQSVVTTVFGGTILETPANEFIKCLIGSKVDAIESALTFLHDNLHVDMPRVNNSVLVLSQDNINEAARPIALAAIGGDSGGGSGGNSDNRGVFGKLIDAYANGLRKERLMFGIFLGLWAVVVLMALAILFWHTYGKNLAHWQKRKRWQAEQRSGFEGIVVPFRVDDTHNEKGRASQSQTSLPEFTPLPSPRPPGTFSPSPARVNEVPYRDSKPKEKSWDSFFNDKEATTRIGARFKSVRTEKPRKLVAIGRKAMGREQLLEDESASAARSQDSNEHSIGGAAVDSKHGGMLGMFTSMFSHKKDVPTTGPTVAALPAVPSSPFGARPSPRARPNLTISVDRASSVRPDFAVNSYQADLPPHDPKSTWPASPATAQRVSPVTMPVPAGTVLRPSLPWTKNIASQPPVLPLRVQHPSSRGVPKPDMRPRHNISVPSDVSASSVADAFSGPNAVLSPAFASPRIAPPLHYGYGGFDSRYPPMRPRRNSSLMPPVDRHRRSVSVPLDALAQSRADAVSESTTPVTRLLTTTHARKSSSVNPFEGTNPFASATTPGSADMRDPFEDASSTRYSVNPFITPFDDEHRVKINDAKPPGIRKSIPTNPFGGVML